MERHVCIHCHFYQPPRENPWLEAVELQDSAYPFHDWNERITAECYAANTASRVLDSFNRIVRIVNNYSRISFNVGPTLLSWMEVNTPQIYGAIIEADVRSRELFSGHGSAIAQVYNHMILPLANRRDKETQVRWGIRDFEKRFGRFPEGMWLAETAVDTESLEVLAENGIKFTVLAPHQARQVRRSERPWRNVEGAKIDPKPAYLRRLPSGREINLFFYDGPISRAVAFEKLLNSGETLANRILSGFTEQRRPQLMHIATDGETYGHHHAHGDMALAYALEHIENNHLAKVTNYGEFLEKHPPTHEVEIVENTSWSCAHGVERWRSDCGCNSGREGWNQKWREPLRNALDWLREDVKEPFEAVGRELIKDPWAARNEYIDLVLDRAPENVDAFLTKHAVRELNADEQVRFLKLLEMQRHAMLMYTSCGWFFDELSGIETVQVMQYAARAIQLAQDLVGDHREQHFMERLAAAPSNIAELQNGAEIYKRFVQPAKLDLVGVGAHFAISSLFEGFPERSSIYSYDVQVSDSRVSQSGRSRLAIGRAQVQSRITRSLADLSFGVLHIGDNQLVAGVRHFRGNEEYEQLIAETENAFSSADIPETIRALDRNFQGTSYSLRSLFRDQQRRIVRNILGSFVEEAESSYTQIYEHHAALIRFLRDMRMPLPPVMLVTAEFVLNRLLRRAFEDEQLDFGRIAALLETANRDGISLDSAGLAYALRRRLDVMADALAANPLDRVVLERTNDALSIVRQLPFEVNLWKIQNVYYGLLNTIYRERLSRDHEEARQWAALFRSLAEKMGINVEAAAGSLLGQPVAA